MSSGAFNCIKILQNIIFGIVWCSTLGYQPIDDINFATKWIKAEYTEMFWRFEVNYWVIDTPFKKLIASQYT